MINTKTAFETVGMGFSLASGWISINGRREWVALTASGKSRGQRGEWAVSASYGTGKDRVEATATVTKGFRYEAADAAIAGLSERANLEAAS